MRVVNQNIFTTIRSEGSILPSDILQRLSEGDSEIGGLSPDSYHLLRGEKLNEAINQSWNRLLGAWATFTEAAQALSAGDPGTTVTRERWLLPLFQELGYGRLIAAKAIEIEGKKYPISHRWENVSIHLVGYGIDLDHRTAGVAGASRNSPHGLIQELLNRSDDCLWGFVTNGYKLRVLRDNVSLTRQAYVEFDLESMMNGEVYSDFVLLWLVCHQSRVEAKRPEECWLEKWSKTANEQGARALDQLRDGVEAAIKALGAGFISHLDNQSLRYALRDGQLDVNDYYRQLLRLVYRLLFLFVAEDRGLLLDPNADEKTKGRYLRFYSLTRLRDLAGRRRGTRHSDLFHALRLVMDGLGKDSGCSALGLPALGSRLFSPEALGDIGNCSVTNRDLLEALRALAFLTVGHTRRPVDYKNLKSEELGSIYEALLELHPVLNTDTGEFELKTVGGSERKSTGSYYTPDSLVQCLLDSALDPVLDETIKKPDPQSALLQLKVCDPACGSGHFLIAAAHRIAKRLASLRSGDSEPSPEATRAALRDVIGHCVYGVDANDMAVELCKVSLWMEALEPGKPLSFLDHRILFGNSLLGATPELLEAGIPDDAFKPIEGDDKKLVTALKRRNRQEREGNNLALFVADTAMEYGYLVDRFVALNEIDDASIDGVQEKAKHYAVLEKSAEYTQAKLLADAWCSAFVWKKVSSAAEPVTENIFRHLESGGSLAPATLQEIDRLTQQYNFFHWHLVFPEVFQGGGDSQTSENGGTVDGGFDVVLGNPPWERIKLQEKEWFASRRPDIANAPNATRRRQMIAALESEDPALYGAFLAARRKSEGESHLIRNSGRFPLSGRGDINTYSIFAETNRMLIAPSGRVGCVVPTGIATDDTTKLFFQSLLDSQAIVSFYDFVNRKPLFPSVERNTRFCLLTVSNVIQDHFIIAAQLDDPVQLKEPERRYSLSLNDIKAINPNTLNCPTVASSWAAQVLRTVHQRIPVFVNETNGENHWGISFLSMFHMTNASEHFRTLEELQNEGFELDGNCFEKDGRRYLPLYEAKLVYQYNHRAATFDGISAEDRFKIHAGTNRLSEEDLLDPLFAAIPRFWIREPEVEKRSCDQSWFFGFRNAISATADSRSAVAAILPRVGVGNSFPLIICLDAQDALKILTGINSFVFDYILRQKASGGNLNFYIFKQLPFLKPTDFLAKPSWLGGKKLADWIQVRGLELVYSALDLESFARDLGYEGPPFLWNEERRFLIRCELDAVYFHLYGIGREDVDYIMETFPIVKRRDEQKHGEYRTKRVILEIYDAMAEAIKTDQPYETILAPPPADPSLAHKPRQAESLSAAVVPTSTPFEPVDTDEDEKFKTCVPLVTLKAAAGSFSDSQEVNSESWVKPNTTRTLRSGMFVAQVVGKSMEPLIPDGAYCLFSAPVIGTRQGKVVLVEHHSIEDPETGGKYTVKRYSSEKTADKSGAWRHTAIRLLPENPDFQPIFINENDASELTVAAEFIEVLGKCKS